MKLIRDLGWYITRDAPEKAARALRRLRGKQYPEEQIEADIANITHHVRLERQLENSASYWDLFKGTDLRRTHIACGLQFGQQWSGVTFIYT
jgi:SP family sugar:H+ symporter-like MFS transporter